MLVVDDNIDSAEMLSALLAASGYEVAIAHDGPSAIEIARGFKPDVALLDIGLPIMDGYELAGHLRGEHAALVLVAVTGYGCRTIANGRRPRGSRCTSRSRSTWPC